MLLSGVIGVGLSACGDDEGPDVTNPSGGGGMGASDGGGQQIGGFMQGPGGGNTGGNENEGGFGEVTHVWSDVKGGTGGSLVAQDVAIDNAGNIVVVGAFTGGPINFGGADLTSATANENDIFVAKFTATGTHIWSDRYGAGNDQGALGVATDAANNIILTGNFKGSFTIGTGTTGTLATTDSQFPDIYVAKLNSDGGHISSASYGIGAGQNDSGNAVDTDASDNIVFAGRFQTSVDFGGGTINAAGGAGDQSLFLAKLGGGFNHTYSQGFGSNLAQEGWAVAGGPSGAMAVGGDSVSDINFGGGNLSNSAGPRGVIARFDGTGSHVFSNLYPGGDSRVVGLAFQSSGELVATGNFKTSIDLGTGSIDAAGAVDDFFVVKYDTAGAVLFARVFGDQARQRASDVALDAEGYAFIVGSFAGDLRVNSMTTLTSAATVQDGFLFVAGPGTGNGYAGVSTNGSTSAEGAGVAVDDSDGSVVVVGNVTGDIDLGGGVETGNASLYIAKYTR